MLIEFLCSNFKSIRDEVTFSMLAGSNTTGLETAYPLPPNNNVLRQAVICGPNGSGKSSLIDAMDFMQTLVVSSAFTKNNSRIACPCHQTLGNHQDSTFDIQFITHNTRFFYGFALNKGIVKSEYLYWYKNEKHNSVFVRDYQDVHYAKQYQEDFRKIGRNPAPNQLMLSVAARFSQIQPILTVYDFFHDELIVCGSQPAPERFGKVLRMIRDDPDIGYAVHLFLTGLDTGIEHLDIDSDPILNPLTALLRFRTGPASFPKVQCMRRKIMTDLFQEESIGIRKLIELLGLYCETCQHGKVLVYDGMDTFLHELDLFTLLSFFRNAKFTDTPQLILSTQNPVMLDSRLLRRDEIWFTALKPDDDSTDLFSLNEIREEESTTDFLHGYLSGRYGAIPQIDLDTDSLTKVFNRPPENNPDRPAKKKKHNPKR